MKKKHKRYFLSVIEEAVLNSDYVGYCGGRVEVFDREAKCDYAIYESRFLIPEEFMEGFRNTFDFKETDLPIFIKWDMVWNENE